MNDPPQEREVLKISRSTAGISSLVSHAPNRLARRVPHEDAASCLFRKDFAEEAGKASTPHERPAYRTGLDGVSTTLLAYPVLD